MVYTDLDPGILTLNQAHILMLCYLLVGDNNYYLVNKDLWSSNYMPHFLLTKHFQYSDKSHTT